MKSGELQRMQRGWIWRDCQCYLQKLFVKMGSASYFSPQHMSSKPAAAQNPTEDASFPSWLTAGTHSVGRALPESNNLLRVNEDIEFGMIRNPWAVHLFESSPPFQRTSPPGPRLLCPQILPTSDRKSLQKKKKMCPC